MTMTPTGYIDGVIAPLDEIRVPVLDRGFLYGDSIYEVFRTYGGALFMFDEHYARLMNSARLSRMQVRQSKRAIIEAVEATIAQAAPDGEEVYVRCQITRGAGAVDLYPSDALHSRLILIVKPLPQWRDELYSRGVTLAIPTLRRNAVNTLDPNIKGGNYLNNILALAEARDLGAEDCLMLDADGRVSECANSNVWFVLDGKLATPQHGNLLGLTRRVLIELLARAGHRDIERPIDAAELPRASECFITSATREVMPVVGLRLADGAQVAFAPGGGELTRLAMRLYADFVAEFIAAQRV